MSLLKTNSHPTQHIPSTTEMVVDVTPVYMKYIKNYGCIPRDNYTNTLKVMYILLMNDQMQQLSSYVRQTLKTYNYANNKLTDELFHILVDIAFKNHNSIHDRIRNLYYKPL